MNYLLIDTNIDLSFHSYAEVFCHTSRSASGLIWWWSCNLCSPLLMAFLIITHKRFSFLYLLAVHRCSTIDLKSCVIDRHQILLKSLCNSLKKVMMIWASPLMSYLLIVAMISKMSFLINIPKMQNTILRQSRYYISWFKNWIICQSKNYQCLHVF